MTDDEVDADIAEMLARHHARKRLGWSYFAHSNHRKVDRVASETARRRANADRQAAWRAKTRLARSASPSTPDEPSND